MFVRSKKKRGLSVFPVGFRVRDSAHQDPIQRTKIHMPRKFGQYPPCDHLKRDERGTFLSEVVYGGADLRTNTKQN